MVTSEYTIAMRRASLHEMFGDGAPAKARKAFERLPRDLGPV
jgi:hypothetical protein